MTTQQLLARVLYDGTGGAARADQVISILDGRFTAIEPYDPGQHGDLPEYPIVTPGLIDIQINGANDIQFNDTPTVEALRHMAIGAQKGGTAWIMPTFITAPRQSYLTAIDATRAAIDAGVPGILGLHLEGPFLSPRRPGIHEQTAIRPIDANDLTALSQPFPGPLLLTLAPEEAQPGAIRALSRAGVTVFAGHSEARHADITTARAEGLRGATHLFNAMSQIMGREPGLVGAVLGSDLYAGIIADGHHVHWANIDIAIRLMEERLCLVTDAMCTLAGTRKEFSLHGERIFLNDGRLTNAAGTLAGAHIAMDQSIRNLITNGLCAPELAVRMASHNPAAALGLSDQIGTIAPGKVACCSLFDAKFQAIDVIRSHGSGLPRR